MKRYGRRSQGMLRLQSLDEVATLRASAPKTQRVPTTLRNTIVEADVLPTIIEALRAHPRVAWAERVNKGFGRLQRPDGSLSPPLAWGYKHALDITGQMRDGRRIEVDAKKPGAKPTPEQQATIDGIRGAGGVAFVACSVADVFEQIPL